MLGRSLIGMVALLVAAITMTACGGGGGESATPADPAAAAGQSLVEASCTGCHSTDGQRRTGPTFAGLGGSQVTLTDGRTLTADDAYLTRSVLDPDAEVHEGYPRGVMSRSVRPGTITEEEAAQMVAYIKTIR